MQFDEFIERVQEQASLETRQQAETITRSVVETLGERLDRKVRDGVMAQLPSELKEFLLARGMDTDRYVLTEFYNRVGARAGLKYHDAAERAWQVCAVLKGSITAGELEDILESLPAEYGELFGEETPGRARPKP
jgi:uncharacterized protein (DUF2267 family)